MIEEGWKEVGEEGRKEGRKSVKEGRTEGRAEGRRNLRALRGGGGGGGDGRKGGSGGDGERRVGKDRAQPQVSGATPRKERKGGKMGSEGREV